ncbi:hypothetical protein Nepgr_001250 [Nepenthes gracilis]|uniref:Protein ENHANCED DISEASE RESISTANCE 2-like n=1 Tax=Nepenthes gracilis TaxID=150966 RepID=A0AAD3P430_NEPGR|nr:hypothetical protein Nepgr_001250 [Nepenthes gracilis]
MSVSKTDGKMEGWLYLITYNRFGLHNIRKRYFVLKDNSLKSFKSIPISDAMVPIGSAIIDSCIRVTDNGRESVHKKVFFFFTLYNTSNHKEQLKLGANSPEDAARWIRSFQDAMLKECSDATKNLVACSGIRFRFGHSRRTNSADWMKYSSARMDAMTTDVIAPSPGKIIGCQNGLRLFKEAKSGVHKELWDDHPAIMAVGVVDGTSETIFQTLMSLGTSRSEWDFCFYRGSVIEHLDGHTDIIYKQLCKDWLPWGMQRRDLLLCRYWRREDDGTYVILYHSVFHKKCPPQRGYVRACLKSGGYVITPMNTGKQSVVRHMLAIDWMSWRSYLQKSCARSITIHMLERVAALRELFRAKAGDDPAREFLSMEFAKAMGLPHSDTVDVKTTLEVPVDIQITEERNVIKYEAERISGTSSIMDLNDAPDEFFDVPESSAYDNFENEWPSGSPESHTPNYQHRLSAAGLVKKLQDLAAQRKSCVDFQESAQVDDITCCYGATLPKDPSFTTACSWAAADPSTFLIRGETYLRDQEKIKAKHTLLQMVGADWLKSDKREDDLAGRPGGIVQKYAAQGGPEFFLIVNIQVPGPSRSAYNLALYYMLKTPLEKDPLLERFVNGDDAYRNSRFKLIPYIPKGSWIVRQSVGKKACLVGHALEVNYFRGNNYLELGIDVGSSTVARGVVSLVLRYLNNLIIEMAFLIQANTEEELPEFLLGTCRLNHLDASKAVLVRR